MNKIIQKLINVSVKFLLENYKNPAVVGLFVELSTLYTKRTDSKLDDLVVEKVAQVVLANNQSEEVKKVTVELLNEYSKSSDNKIDDFVVHTVDKLLFNK